MSPEEFRLIAERIREHCGLRFDPGRGYLLEHRLWARLRENGLGDFTAYYRLLQFGAHREAELEAAVEALTTNETYFFRDPLQLRSFARELLPELARKHAGQRRLRIWSAGCSSGEEAYTLAMLVRESGLFSGWDVEVVGTDISRRVIALARKGSYARSALRETSPLLAQRYFEPEGGRFRVRPEVRERVSFGQLNLLDEAKVSVLAHQDVVFCRNVMIYFDLPVRRRLLQSLHGRLNPGGYLLLGHAESLINLSTDFELVQLEHDLVYRKPAP